MDSSAAPKEGADAQAEAPPGEQDEAPVIEITGLAAQDEGGDASAGEITGTELTGDEAAALVAASEREGDGGGAGAGGAGAGVALESSGNEGPAELPGPGGALVPLEAAGPVALQPAWAPSTWFLGVTAFLVAAADLGTKEWAKYALAGPDLKRTAKHITAIPGYVDFIFAQNPGGAWSFLRSVPDGLRRPFFLFVSAAAIVFIVTVYQRLERRQWAMRWGLPLALGGAIGNLSDRVRYGWVVDFIDMYWKRGDQETHWPTYNVADVAIVFGVALMALDLLSLRRGGAPGTSQPSPETASGAA